MEALSTTVMECTLVRTLESQYAVDNPIIPPPTITTAEPSELFCLLAAIYLPTSRCPDWPLSKECVLLPGQLTIETERRAIGCELDVVRQASRFTLGQIYLGKATSDLPLVVAGEPVQKYSESSQW